MTDTERTQREEDAKRFREIVNAAWEYGRSKTKTTVTSTTNSEVITEISKKKKIDGSSDYHKFQKDIAKLIQEIFADSLIAMSSQLPNGRTDTTFVILDSADSIFHEIKEIFQSLVIVLECKHYKSDIRDNQIIITEKYLYPKAKRSVCILVTKGKFANSAKKAAVSALRESGKLFLFFAKDDLNKLIDSYIHREHNRYFRQHVINSLALIGPY